MAAASETPISPVGVSKPELTISAPSVNDEPVELDSTPTSSDKARAARRGSQADVLSELSPEERERRERLISERKGDRAVLVDIPGTPGAEEFGRAKDAEATVTDKANTSSAS